ncbi:MAG: patatin-like phospholipase family protein [Anaerolineae bacterium]
MSTNEQAKSARSRSEPAIGLALSGGGIRGLAHLGVLQVLEEQGLPIGAMAGTSMGGLIAGAYAAGVSLSDLRAFAVKTRILDLASPDRTWHGFFDHRKLRTLLIDLLGSESLTFEDLRVPVAVTATDIETGQLVILDAGPLIPALMATAALPIFFAPVRHQERWLVDGGIVNNLPVDVVRHLGADRVLGVTIAPSTHFDLEPRPKETRTRGLSLQGLLQFGNRARDWRLPFLIAETSLGWTQELINQTRMELCPPDLLLRIRLPNIGILSTDGSEDAIKSGYEAAMAQQEALRALSEPLPPQWQRRCQSLWRRLRLSWRILREGRQPLYPPSEWY